MADQGFIQIGNFLARVASQDGTESRFITAFENQEFGTSSVNRSKLDSAFDGEIVVHTSCLLAGRRMETPPTAWRRDGKIGRGAYGAVWRERDLQSGQFRAVKIISKHLVNEREVESLAKMQDVSLGFLPVGAINGWLASAPFRLVFRLV